MLEGSWGVYVGLRVWGKGIANWCWQVGSGIVGFSVNQELRDCMTEGL